MSTPFRRYRTSQAIRDLYAETHLFADDYIIPYFIVEGKQKKLEIASLPNVFHISTDELLKDIENLLQLGINKILLFGVPEESEKDENGSRAWALDNIVAKSIKAVKKHFPEIVVFTDVCLCAYTRHGHCGVLDNHTVDNDSTLPLLANMALSHAEAGADFVSPSAMMDGQINAIRNALDKHHLEYTQIMAYSAKYASSLYGPFRDAAHSAPSFGNRKTYQMDYRNSNQALSEIEADIDEGADIIMVKPAHTYLDIIARARNQYPTVKMAAYHVSGEYAMIKAAARQGIVDEETAFKEIHTAIKRAGSDLIITYYKPKPEFYKSY